jgi:hypothetical protein
VAALPASATSVYFPQTGHNVTGAFLHFYRTYGGLDIFGYPRTEAIPMDGLTVQYFQRARFELHPELPAGQQVQLTLLGDQLTADQRPFPTVAPFVSGVQHEYFAATQHAVSFGFLHYFWSRGELAVFGYPTSEELRVPSPHGMTTIQYFQRARFEYHPEFAGTPYEVELGLLGDQLLTRMGWLPLPAGGAPVPATASTSASSVTLAPTATPIARTTSGFRVGETIAVTWGTLDVHSAASADSPVVATLTAGTKAQITALATGWVRVAVGGQEQGWLSTANLSAG